MNEAANSFVITKNIIKFLDNIKLYQIILLALILRIIWILLIPTPPVSDYLWYFDRGGEIASGSGYTINGVPTAYWPIGYPAFLGVLFFITGKSVLAGQLANTILFLLVIILFSKTLQKHKIDKRIISFTGIVLAISLNYIAYSGILQVETLALFLLLCALLLTHLFFESEKRRFLISASIIYALLIYVKPQSFFLPMCIFPVYYFKYKRISIKNLIYIYGIIVLILIPWAIRNYNIFNEFIPVSTNGGINFYVGNGPDATGKYREGFVFPETKNGAEESRIGLQLALEHIVKHPMTWLKLIPIKLYYLYRDDVDGIMWTMVSAENKFTPVLRVLKWIWQAAYIMIMIPFLISIIRAFKKKLQLIEILSFVIIIYFSLIVVMFFGLARFHYVILPFIILMSIKEAITIRKTILNRNRMKI